MVGSLTFKAGGAAVIGGEGGNNYFAQWTKGEVECALERMNERQTGRKAS
jgi:hypothetical protein